MNMRMLPETLCTCVRHDHLDNRGVADHGEEGFRPHKVTNFLILSNNNTYVFSYRYDVLVICNRFG